MINSLCVQVDTDGVMCGFDCEYLDPFGVSAETEEPVPRCSLCDQFLNTENDIPLRCCKCLDMERLFNEEARKKAMRDAVQNKPFALSLLEQTNYRVDIASFNTAHDLIEYLVQHEKISKTYLQTELGLTQPDFQTLLDGKEYPYVSAVVQQHLGVPRPTHITAQDELERARKALHWSEQD